MIRDSVYSASLTRKVENKREKRKQSLCRKDRKTNGITYR